MKRQDFPQKPLHYRAYVIRCWQERSVHTGAETVVWRFNFQVPRSNQRHGYATLEALLISLQEELAMRTSIETRQSLKYSHPNCGIQG